MSKISKKKYDLLSDDRSLNNIINFFDSFIFFNEIFSLKEISNLN